MRELEIGNKTISDSDCFVIAEIGSNHMGDPDLCERMIVEAAKCGVDAVKMQKRNNQKMFTKTALAKPYNNELSYGATYGEHREHLDWFGKKEFERFKATAEKHGVIFFATPFEEDSAKFLHDLGVDLWKIASCDVTNIPLVKKIAGYNQPMIISTGGVSLDDIFALFDAISPINDNFALLHCISTYPNTDLTLNLNIITTLRQLFPYKVIGFSSHHPGVLPLMVARTLGASIFEVHFTLNRGERGTDHGFSMEPRGLELICKDLKRIGIMLGSHDKKVLDVEKGGFVSKMGKSIYVNRFIPAGEVLKKDNICLKSPATGLKPSEIDRIIGKELICDISTGIALQGKDFDEPFDLTGKTALVTGGRNGLLGPIWVECLKEAGVKVDIFDLPNDDVKNPVYSRLDYDILVNNAAIDNPPGSEASFFGKFDEIMAVNISGAVNMCKMIIPGMIKRGGGVIINIGSIMGYGGADWTNYEGAFEKPFGYNASKWALRGLAKSITTQYGRYGIRSVTISFGPYSGGKLERKFLLRFLRRVPLCKTISKESLKMSILYACCCPELAGVDWRIDAGLGAWA